MSLDLDPLHLGALAHPETSSQWYLHLFNKALWCLTDITRLVRCGISSVGSGFTSAGAGVIHWLQVAAVGLWAAACLGVTGATDGCAVGRGAH